MNYLHRMLITILLAFSGISCDNRDQEPDPSPYSEFKRETQARLAVIGEKLDDMGDDAAELQQETVEELKEEYAKAKNKLDELGDEVSEEWAEAKVELEIMVNKLERRIDQAMDA